MKECNKCKEWKMLTEFVKHKGYKDGIYSQCKSCTYALEKAWRQKNQDKKNAIRTIYRENNRERIRIQDQENYKKNPEKFQDSAKVRMKKYLSGKGKETRELNKILNPEKHEARKIMTAAVRSKKIIKPKSCTMCNTEVNRIEGHHEDYLKPLEIIWLCCKCHRSLHRKETIHADRLSGRTAKADATVKSSEETTREKPEEVSPPLRFLRRIGQ